MIIPAGNFRVYIATEAIDFRKGMDGLAGHIKATFDLDPFSGAIFVFRSRHASKLKMLVWDCTGLVLVSKRMSGKRFIWPKPQSGPLVLTKVQLDALFEGADWRQVQAVAAAPKPEFI